MKYTAATKKIAKDMGEFKDKKHMSSSGQKVKTRNQAVAIAMSEAKRMKKGMK